MHSTYHDEIGILDIIVDHEVMLMRIKCYSDHIDENMLGDSEE